MPAITKAARGVSAVSKAHAAKTIPHPASSNKKPESFMPLAVS